MIIIHQRYPMNCIYSIVARFKKNSYILLEEQNNEVMFFLSSKVQFKVADHAKEQEILDFRFLYRESMGPKDVLSHEAFGQ